MEFYTVKQLSEILGVNEETIKRWIRSEMFPGAKKESNIDGWRIPSIDLSIIGEYKPKLKEKIQTIINLSSKDNGEQVRSTSKVEVNLETQLSDMYKLAILREPEEEVIHFLVNQGYERAFELLLTMREYSQNNYIRSPMAYLKKSVVENWTAATDPYATGKKEKPMTKESVKSNKKKIKKEILPEWFNANEKDNNAKKQLSKEEKERFELIQEKIAKFRGSLENTK